jgi:hypothetical protein
MRGILADGYDDDGDILYLSYYIFLDFKMFTCYLYELYCARARTYPHKIRNIKECDRRIEVHSGLCNSI